MIKPDVITALINTQIALNKERAQRSANAAFSIHMREAKKAQKLGHNDLAAANKNVAKQIRKLASKDGHIVDPAIQFS